MQPVRLMGDGYEPHVAQLGEQLSYSLPSTPGLSVLASRLLFARPILMFCFPITIDVRYLRLLHTRCSSVQLFLAMPVLPKTTSMVLSQIHSIHRAIFSRLSSQK